MGWDTHGGVWGGRRPRPSRGWWWRCRCCRTASQPRQSSPEPPRPLTSPPGALNNWHVLNKFFNMSFIKSTRGSKQLTCSLTNPLICHMSFNMSFIKSNRASKQLICPIKSFNKTTWGIRRHCISSCLVCSSCVEQQSNDIRFWPNWSY